MRKVSRRRSRDQPIPPHKAAFSGMAARTQLNQPGNKNRSFGIDLKVCDLAGFETPIHCCYMSCCIKSGPRPRQPALTGNGGE